MYNFLYTTGEHMVTYSFVNSALCDVWFSGVRDIKSLIKDIDDDGHAGLPRVPKYRRWLALVNAFVQEWGEKLLPPDIKRSVNEVEAGIGEPATIWEDPPENYRA